MKKDHSISVSSQFYHCGPTFLDKLIDECKESRIDLHNLSIDHLCLRVSSEIMYNLAQEQLEEFKAEVIGEKDHIVNGRPITLWRLPTPLFYENKFLGREQFIEILELSSPKPDHDYKDGIQHAEFYPHDHPFALKSADIYLKHLLNKYPFVPWEKNLNSYYNPTIAHSFNRDLEIKIHPYPIDIVVKFEQGLLTPAG